MQKAIFLDRDGVINSDKGHYYIYKRDDFKINTGIIPSLKKFSDAGYLLFVVTNQGGVAKGIYTMDDVNAVHSYLQEQLLLEDIRLTHIYTCPHHESVTPCSCRKPSPYFILKAIDNFNLDSKECFLIGDSERDIQSAQGAGIKGILINSNEDITPYCTKILNHEI